MAGSPPAAVEEALQRLGRNIRTARLRRRLPQTELAERMGVSRFVVADVERGKPTTGVAAYVGALWVLGLLVRPVRSGRPGPIRRGRQDAGTRTQPEAGAGPPVAER